MSDETIEIVRTVDGRYVWNPILMGVEYYPKADRRIERTLPLYENTNTFDGAMRTVARDLARQYSKSREDSRAVR
jgi:hypothetical protein